ncbi:MULTISPECIES: hypothetical protein [Paenarthrobacter]|uniref:Uncharacterized protein n=1 Tax=Paenarthrobacter ureafaciens TaxID=37931 RepID=A0AAX3EKD9_PAEUR|nr:MULTISPECIES: hypothetical protein [Paenarthrobacter]MDO5863439.1 hypothetical protein [Paenarthrobacter sp. SD-2]MDO5874508.1 hypothetical protein [Paenarthrobacter sp. SD-1]UYV93914.1 hypothetical protein NL395_04275 [Paenarthrobacter ureafaciens]UYV98440.1 hypothetical protein NL394_04215 [Paenarthrobacter ureafaciens]WIV29756.1 hypothetical protein QN084_15625 [Paenarthrobacter sp. R1]
MDCDGEGSAVEAAAVVVDGEAVAGVVEAAAVEGDDDAVTGAGTVGS